MTTTCAARPTSCGTASGWRAGGRCVRCRMAHNAETNKYRGLVTEERTAFLDALNSGLSPDAAAKRAGVSTQSLAAAAANDGELRAALGGQPVTVQRAARKGDLLAALTRTGGIMEDALLLVGIDTQTVRTWREEDPGYVSAEDAVLRWLASARSTPKRRIPDEALDRAASLIEQGQSVRAAAAVVGVSGHGLRKASVRHARLAAAMPPPQENKAGKGRVTKLTAKAEHEVRRLWADSRISKASIARQLGVHDRTLRKWVERLDLPPDRGQGVDAATAQTGRTEKP